MATKVQIKVANAIRIDREKGFDAAASSAGFVSDHQRDWFKAVVNKHRANEGRELL